jgi:predicted  nucleic acid-binding Zn-ribbon protein
VTVLTTAAAAAVVLSANAANAAPSEKLNKDEVKSKVDKLYEETEQATEKLDGAKEKQDKLEKEISTLQDNVARGQDELNALRDGLGSMASAQYRTGGIDPSVALFLSSDPDDYLDKASAMDQLSSQQVEALKKVQEKQRSLAQQRQEASAKLKDLADTRTELAKQKKTVQTKLAAAQKLLNSLTAKEKAARRPRYTRVRARRCRVLRRTDQDRLAVRLRRLRPQLLRLLGLHLVGVRPGRCLHPAHLGVAGDHRHPHLLAERSAGRRPGLLLRRPAPRRPLRGQRPGAARPAHRNRRALRVDEHHRWSVPVRRPGLIRLPEPSEILSRPPRHAARTGESR